MWRCGTQGPDVNDGDAIRQLGSCCQPCSRQLLSTGSFTTGENPKHTAPVCECVSVCVWVTVKRTHWQTVEAPVVIKTHFGLLEPVPHQTLRCSFCCFCFCVCLRVGHCMRFVSFLVIVDRTARRPALCSSATFRPSLFFFSPCGLT